MSLTEKIHGVIQDIMATDINGCIAGSSALPDVDFDLWESEPDVDIFVYNEPELMHAIDVLVLEKGFSFISKGEEVKFGWLRGRYKNGMSLSTHKVEKDGIIVNITYKNYKRDVISVLKSFDMSIIMVGWDIPTGIGYDLRTRSGFIMADPDAKWSDDVKKAVPNPLREQNATMYTVPMWVRQFDRVEKYWNRGFNTIPMAEYYVYLITAVIECGVLFKTEANEIKYQDFIAEFGPQRDKMIAWIEEKRKCL